MKALVVYYSRGGKTRKLAETIAQELGCETIDIEKKTPDVSGVDLLIVGSGNYGGKPGKELQKFLDNLKPTTNCKVAVFATSGGSEPKCIDVMSKALKTKSYKIISTFDCRGQMLLLNRGHPTQNDLENAKAFAGSLKKLSVK